MTGSVLISPGAVDCAYASLAEADHLEAALRALGAARMHRWRGQRRSNEGQGAPGYYSRDRGHVYMTTIAGLTPDQFGALADLVHERADRSLWTASYIVAAALGWTEAWAFRADSGHAVDATRAVRTALEAQTAAHRVVGIDDRCATVVCRAQKDAANLAVLVALNDGLATRLSPWQPFRVPPVPPVEED